MPAAANDAQNPAGVAVADPRPPIVGNNDAGQAVMTTATLTANPATGHPGAFAVKPACVGTNDDQTADPQALSGLTVQPAYASDNLAALAQAAAGIAAQPVHGWADTSYTMAKAPGGMGGQAASTAADNPSAAATAAISSASQSPYTGGRDRPGVAQTTADVAEPPVDVGGDNLSGAAARPAEAGDAKASAVAQAMAGVAGQPAYGSAGDNRVEEPRLTTGVAAKPRSLGNSDNPVTAPRVTTVGAAVPDTLAGAGNHADGAQASVSNAAPPAAASIPTGATSDVATAKEVGVPTVAVPLAVVPPLASPAPAAVSARAAAQASNIPSRTGPPRSTVAAQGGSAPPAPPTAQALPVQETANPIDTPAQIAVDQSAGADGIDPGQAPGSGPLRSRTSTAAVMNASHADRDVASLPAGQIDSLGGPATPATADRSQPSEVVPAAILAASSPQETPASPRVPPSAAAVASTVASTGPGQVPIVGPPPGQITAPEHRTALHATQADADPRLPESPKIVAQGEMTSSVVPSVEPATVSVTATASAHQTSPTSPTDQVAPTLLTLAKAIDGTQEMTVRLHPGELGMVQLKIAREISGATQIEITADNPTTLLALQRDQPQLHRTLDEAG
ncbi:MAG: flagellar hook-length control protein FliK, partial [Pseudomonadota bacterium]|nr:flagellar hook-length control protein FliK [Pseudomonadota bacterium]